MHKMLIVSLALYAKCLRLQGIWSCQRQLNSARQRGAQHILKTLGIGSRPQTHLMFANKMYHRNGGNYRATICVSITGTPYHPSEKGRWQDRGGVAKELQLWLEDCKPTCHRETIIKCTCLSHYVQNTT